MMIERVCDGIIRIGGSVWGGALLCGGHALLIDAPELPWGESLQAVLVGQGVHTVDGVLLTQHRRAHAGGLSAWEGPLPKLYATAPEAALLRHASECWESNCGLTHRYHCIPDRFLPLDGLAVDEELRDGQTLRWRGFDVRCVAFNALSKGDCAYVVERDGLCVAFVGALAMEGGHIHDLYSLQNPIPGLMGYHSYLGGYLGWRRGVRALREFGLQLLLPAYGGVISAPDDCLALLDSRLYAYAEAYVRISAVRYYFPEAFRQGFELPLGLNVGVHRAKTGTHPEWLFRIGETTSYLLRAPSGRAVLIDAGDAEAVQTVLDLLERGEIAHLDFCFVTHAHDDHLNAMGMLTHALDVPIVTTAAVEEVISLPAAWFLPALPDGNTRCRIAEDGERIQWEGMELTFLHFPGQCVCHGALLVEFGDARVLLCGDSFAPTGLDDYCADNRNLPGEGRGYRACFDTLRQYGVRQLVNEHQSVPFLYEDVDLVFWRDGMDARDACLAELLPGDVGFGLDSQWMRVYPMEQTVTAGSPLRLNVQITAHGAHEIAFAPRIPWMDATPVLTRCATQGLSSGSVRVQTSKVPADAQFAIDLRAPEGVRALYKIPFDCYLDGAFIGSYLTCIVRVV